MSLQTRAGLLEAGRLSELFAALQARGYRLVGPCMQEGAIVYDELASVRDLPWGWGDEQEKGWYRLKKRTDGACFAYAVGPHSWKKYLFLPREKLYEAHRRGGDLGIVPQAVESVPTALIGVRACELAALAIQDRVFMGDSYVDEAYAARRRQIFIVAVHCTQAAATCFCASMGCGPRVEAGFDLAMTERLDEKGHFFLLETGSAAGAEVAAELQLRETDESLWQAAREAVAETGRAMKRSLSGEGLQDFLYRNLGHARWQEVAERCLSCGNCTLVCPTCFCHRLEDVTDLSGDHAERWRRWDSCFNLDFSYLHGGGSVRASTESRYRQWLTHKLATWIDQFGTSGCVGCGRCITWCPVGIDLTEEVAAMRSASS